MKNRKILGTVKAALVAAIYAVLTSILWEFSSLAVQVRVSEALSVLPAFSGASGVGKSTLMNSLFPNLALSTSEVSKKTERGRHTTRQTELFVIRDGEMPVFLADTPGFTMLDFEQFDFFKLEDLPSTMRDFEPYIGECKYKKCTHTKEDGCAILKAVKDGEISESRHKSYLALYETLKAKKKW